MLEVGAQIPDISIADETGEAISLHDLARGYLVLWFYPKDDTPG